MLGSTSATAGASSLTAPPPGGGATAPPLRVGDVVSLLPSPLADSGLSLPATSAVAPRGTRTTTGLTSEVPVSFTYDGVPLSLLIGLALLALAGSSRVRRYMDRIIGVVGG